MGDPKNHRRFENALGGRTCISALPRVGCCAGNAGQATGTQSEALQQGLLADPDDHAAHADQPGLRSRGAVLTSRNNNSRTGANLFERDLKPSNVNVSSFGLRYTRNLDGKVYAQPLFVPDVQRAHFEGWKRHVSRHDIVYVVTEHNTVYAFDANDVYNPNPLCSRNLGPSVPSPHVND